MHYIYIKYVCALCFLTPNINLIPLNFRFIVISDFQFMQKAARVISLCTAGEVSEIWQHEFDFYCNEALVVAKTIGIDCKAKVVRVFVFSSLSFSLFLSHSLILPLSLRSLHLPSDCIRH